MPLKNRQENHHEETDHHGIGAEKGKIVKAVKGGSWNSKRTSCRTEARDEGRAPNAGYGTVGFRVAREK